MKIRDDDMLSMALPPMRSAGCGRDRLGRAAEEIWSVGESESFALSKADRQSWPLLRHRESTSARYETWLRELEADSGAYLGAGCIARRRKRRTTAARKQKLTATALSQPRSLVSMRTPKATMVAFGESLSSSRFMLPLTMAPMDREAVIACSQRLRDAIARQANLEDDDSFQGGQTLWGLINHSMQAPPSLCSSWSFESDVTPSLKWQEGGDVKEVATLHDEEWSVSDREYSRRIVDTLCRPTAWCDDSISSPLNGRRRRIRSNSIPLAIVKVSPTARDTALGVALLRQLGTRGLTIGASSRTGHAVALVRTREAIQNIVDILLDTPPPASGPAGSVLIQGYVRPKGTTPWIVRVASLQRRGPRGWIISDPSDPWVTNSASRRCSIVRASSASSAWAKPKQLASDLLCACNHQPKVLALAELAADFVQDDDGHWWLIQFKAYRSLDSSERPSLLRQIQKSRSIPHQESASFVESDGDATPGCEGEYCDRQLPVEAEHLYGQTLDQGAVFTLPRKVLIDRPRCLDRVLPDVSLLSRKDRLSLYDRILVCANCHYEYIGRHKFVGARSKEGPCSARETGALSPVQVDRSEITPPPAPSPTENEIGPLTLSPPDDSHLTGFQEFCKPSPDAQFEPSSGRELQPADSASALRSAFADIDNIHERAVEQLEHEMHANLTASIFLSTLDEAIENAEIRGRERGAQVL